MKKLFTFLFLFIVFQISAQAPAGYYTVAEGKTDASLKTSLYGIISSGYVSKTYDFLYTIYETSDKTASGKVWDMYSTCDWDFFAKLCGSYSVICDCQNREHSIPQSWFNEASPMKSDAFHVYPTDGKVNGIRSSFPYGETNALPIGGKALGKIGSSSFTGYSGTVFEPIDEYKGDFARTYFYFATRYENIMTSIGGESFNKTVYPSFPGWVINLFLKWHRQDPVSQKEMDRNNAVYVYQKNRNPFIDYPDLAEYIWGDKKGIPWSQQVATGPRLLTPFNNSVIDFGNIPYQQNSTVIIDLKAANLTGDLTLGLSGANATNFSISTNTISKAAAEAGVKLSITCNPQQLGLVTAVLDITGGGLTAYKVNLKATSTDSFLAMAATNITSTSFTANWTASANATDYLLDVFSKKVTGTQSKTIVEANFNDNVIPAGWTTTGYSDFSLSGSIKMASSSQNCTLTTPTVDLSTNTILTVIAKQFSNDAGATIKVTVNSDSLTTFTTGVDFQTFSIAIPETNNASTVTFTVLKGKRAYIDYIKIATEGSIETPVSIAGYPKNAGNVLSYSVTGLTADSTYYYTVTPQGNGAAVSDEIEVRTSVSTDIKDRFDIPELIAYFAGSTLYVSNLEPGSKLTIYTVLGNKISEHPVNGNEISIPFNYKGIFILQVSNNERITGVRKMILH